MKATTIVLTAVFSAAALVGCGKEEPSKTPAPPPTTPAPAPTAQSGTTSVSGTVTIPTTLPGSLTAATQKAGAATRPSSP